MGPSCYVKKQSNPPWCGVHSVALQKITLPVDEYAPYLGLVTCYVCPVSHSVVTEGAQGTPG